MSHKKWEYNFVSTPYSHFLTDNTENKKWKIEVNTPDRNNEDIDLFLKQPILSQQFINDCTEYGTEVNTTISMYKHFTISEVL